MKIRYFADTDSLYIKLKDGPSVETREVVDGLNIDVDAGGAVVGFDIDHLSQLAANLGALDAGALPLRQLPAPAVGQRRQGPG